LAKVLSAKLFRNHQGLALLAHGLFSSQHFLHWLSLSGIPRRLDGPEAMADCAHPVFWGVMCHCPLLLFDQRLCLPWLFPNPRSKPQAEINPSDRVSPDQNWEFPDYSMVLSDL
jgi:hypothetical protein